MLLRLRSTANAAPLVRLEGCYLVLPIEVLPIEPCVRAAITPAGVGA